MNKLQRIVNAIVLPIVLTGCSTTNNRSTITWRQVHENPICYNLFDYRILSEEEALKERGSTEEEYRKANQYNKRKILPFNRR